MAIYLKDGKVITDKDGKVYDCDKCPCTDCDPEKCKGVKTLARHTFSGGDSWSIPSSLHAPGVGDCACYWWIFQKRCREYHLIHIGVQQGRISADGTLLGLQKEIRNPVRTPGECHFELYIATAPKDWHPPYQNE